MRALTVFAVLTAQLTFAAARVEGELIVVEDTTGQALTPGLTGVALPLCAFAAKGLYGLKPDDYDGVVAVTTHPMNTSAYALSLTPAGYVVRQPEQGVAQGGFFVEQPPSAYGSAARLSHCVYFGPLRILPANPDAAFMQPAGPFGGMTNSGMTAIEVLGHEYGHHWLLGANYDQGDGQGPQTLIRADTRMNSGGTSTGPSTSATLHYSVLADSHSVMWGSFITPLGGDSYRLEGGDRKYGPLDQYLMGLRSAAETPPLLVLDDGTHLGLSDTTLAKGQSSVTAGSAVHVEVQDVIRAIGPRVPAYPNTKRCFRVAFVVVTPAGTTATAAELSVIDGYRRRFQSWFSWATDGRGSIDTRLVAPDACQPKPEPDAGTGLDAGVPDAGRAMDAGEPIELGPPPPPDAGADEELPVIDNGTSHLRPGCGCSSVEPLGLFGALASIAARRRRRTEPSRVASRYSPTEQYR